MNKSEMQIAQQMIMPCRKTIMAMTVATNMKLVGEALHHAKTHRRTAGNV